MLTGRNSEQYVSGEVGSSAARAAERSVPKDWRRAQFWVAASSVHSNWKSGSAGFGGAQANARRIASPIDLGSGGGTTFVLW